MDPYLEEHWRDVHHSFLTYARDDLQQGLPGDLRARLEERVFVEPDQGEPRSFYPDIRVIERPGRAATVGQEGPKAAAADMIVLRAESELASEGFIEIIDVGSGNRVVTVIELLSASNKFPGDGQDQYLEKQREYLRAGVSLVEIDLLREGKRVLAVPRHLIPPSHATTYNVCVTRGWKPGYFELYAVPLDKRLPTVNVPLRERDHDAPLDLQALVDRCYQNGRYDDIDYRRDTAQPLSADDARWTQELLASQGQRS
jgi:hypothetical protein